MKTLNFFLLVIFSTSLLIVSAFGQDGDSFPPPPPQPTPPKLSKTFAKKLKELPSNFKTSRENRQKAYEKLLEGQRYIWTMRRPQNPSNMRENGRLAKKALHEAVELDPTFAEAYTTLAELEIWGVSKDVGEAIGFAEIATSLDKENFGGFRILGWMYSFESNIGRGRVTKSDAEKAIAAWRGVTRLDPRNAEAWAFLSAYYKETGQIDLRIEALRKWLASSMPIEVGFYNRIMIQEGELSLENASIKLGEALLEKENYGEALAVLTRAVSDSPNNLEAVGLLSRALENTKGESLKPAVEALRQSVFANPDNVSLNLLLAQTIAKAGNLEDAEKFLKDSIRKFAVVDAKTASTFQLSLGDIYAEAGLTDKAISSYRKTLILREIDKDELATDEKRDFAFLVVNKIVRAFKSAERFSDAKNTIDNYRALFGEQDLSLDREYINLLRDSGKRNESLDAVRSARKRSPEDYSLIRTEATILTEIGKVDEGVSLILNLIDRKPENAVRSIMYDDYINYLFISSLYIQANRNEQAIETAHKAVDAADCNAPETVNCKERTQIARLTLASATQSAGNYEAAEDILKDILKETPDNPIALNNLGYLFLERGDNLEQALQLINKAVEIDPRNPSYLDSLGWAYYKLGRLDDAEKYLVKATQLNANSATIFEHLGDVYLKKGKILEAKEAWKKALTYSSNEIETQRIEKKLSR